MRHCLTIFAITILLTFAAYSNSNNTTTPAPTVFKCASDSDCSFKGRCETIKGKCHCFPGYTDDNCSYKMKKQETAFWHQFPLGFFHGGGQFYVGNKNLGAGQASLFWGSLLCVIFTNNDPNIFTVLGMTGLAGSIVWSIVDSVRFSQNTIKDSQGMPLQSW